MSSHVSPAATQVPLLARRSARSATPRTTCPLALPPAPRFAAPSASVSLPPLPPSSHSRWPLPPCRPQCLWPLPMAVTARPSPCQPLPPLPRLPPLPPVASPAWPPAPPARPPSPSAPRRPRAPPCSAPAASSCSPPPKQAAMRSQQSACGRQTTKAQLWERGERVVDSGWCQRIGDGRGAVAFATSRSLFALFVRVCVC
mmetsp:Transcript_89024/g.157668  ORF Transcript_89024/g.157668 Transcript_89024/m.157668 type:complete len:200 (-) Transcript_89024:139-738(-)